MTDSRDAVVIAARALDHYLCGHGAPEIIVLNKLRNDLHDALSEHDALGAQAIYHRCNYNVSHGIYCDRPLGHHGNCMNDFQMQREKERTSHPSL